MAMISSSKEIRKLVRQSLDRYDWLYLEPGARHFKVRNRRTRDFIPIPFSPSDQRAVANLSAQLRRLADQGLGLMSARGAFC